MIRNEGEREKEGERKAVSGSWSAAYDNISHPELFCIPPLGVIIGAWRWYKKRLKKMLVCSIYVECDLIQSCRKYLWPSGRACFFLLHLIRTRSLTMLWVFKTLNLHFFKNLNKKHPYTHTYRITTPHVNYQVPFQRTFASLAVLIIIVVCISLRDGEFFFLSSLIRIQLIHCDCGAAGGIWTASLCLSPVWASLKSGAVIICRCSSWQGSKKQMRTLGGVRGLSHTPLPIIHPYDVGLKWHCNFN